MATLHRPEAKGLFSFTESHFRKPSAMRERVFMAAAHLALAHNYVYEENGQGTLATVESFLREQGSAVYFTAGPLYAHGDTDIAYTWIPPSQRAKYQGPQYALQVALSVQERLDALTQAEMPEDGNLEALRLTGVPDLQLPPRLYDNLLNQRQAPPESIWG